MSDKLIIATASNNNVRILAANTTELVNEGTKMHDCAPTAAAAFGRLLTAGSIMGAMLKSPKDSLTIQLDGGGIAGKVMVTAHADSSVKGYISNPCADLVPNEKGKLDVSGIIGKNGTLTVVKDMGLRDPYSGQVPIYTGEIGDDLAYYFTVSEQTPSAVGLGVLVDKDITIKAAGGFIIQMLPGADDMLADLITYRLEEIPSITDLLVKGMTVEEILQFIFEDMDLKIIGEMKPKYKCDCSIERVEKALISIGIDELTQIYNEGKDEELKCNFCNKSYTFSHEHIGNIIKALGSASK